MSFEPSTRSLSTDSSPVSAQPAYTVVIPVYNEVDAIDGTLDRMIEVLEQAEQSAEIIVVNDGSTDGTAGVLRCRHGIRLLEHPTNRGYGASLKTGIRHARAPLVVITDADGTYPLERIPEFVEIAVREEADMVVGARDTKNQQRLRRLPKWFLTRFAEWMVRRPIPDLNSGMRVFRKSVVDRFLSILPDGFSFTTTITLALLSNGYLVHYEPIEYLARVGQSKIRPIRDTLGFVQLILRTGMYFAPLRVFLPVAGLFFVGFLLSLAWDVYLGNLTDKTLLLLVAAAQLGMFALLADMIDKRSA